MNEKHTPDMEISPEEDCNKEVQIKVEMKLITGNRATVQ